MSERHISTTALARQLHKDSRELFTLLAQGGWIIKVDNHWQLTEKGKFEGGVYMNHPKYGDYIAWPESVQDHPLLKLLPVAPLSATHLSNKFGVPARLMNLILAERGWIKKNIRGWLLTAKGKALGGEQHYSEQTAIPYTTWPETILENQSLLAAIAQTNGDFFSTSPVALSGFAVETKIAAIIENWLYIAGINHARQYPLLDADEKMYVDFFLPELQLCLDIWSHQDTAATLSDNFNKQAFYKKHAIDFIEIHESTIDKVDELLAKQLLHFGLAVY